MVYIIKDIIIFMVLLIFIGYFFKLSLKKVDNNTLNKPNTNPLINKWFNFNLIIWLEIIGYIYYLRQGFKMAKT